MCIDAHLTTPASSSPPPHDVPDAFPIASARSGEGQFASPGKQDGDTELVDVHAHFVTENYVAAAIAAGHTSPDGFPSLPNWSADEHLALMDSVGISVSVLSVSSPGVHFGDNGKARALAREVNEFAAGVIAAHPTRFGQFASLPLPDVDGAIEEATYALDTLGADGVTILSNSAGIYLGNSVLDPLLEELNRRRATVFVHPTSPPNWESVSPNRPRPLIEFLFDTARTVVDLILSDRLERFPDIQWIFTHGGGVLPLLADRVELFRSVFGGGEASATDLLSMLWYDSAGTPFPRQLPALVDIVGTQRILYGSDYCFTTPPVVKAQVATIDSAPAAEGAAHWRELTTANARRLLPHLEMAGHNN